MSIKRQIKLSPLSCMQPTDGLQICPLNTEEVITEFKQPLWGHETTLVTISPGTIEELFVHHYQTDQILVVRGSAVMVILQNRQYRYIPLHECKPTLITIPPGVPHGAVNLSNEPCIAINSVLRHGPAYEKDYRPLQQPFPYDLEAAKAALAEFECPI